MNIVAVIAAGVVVGVMLTLAIFVMILPFFDKSEEYEELDRGEDIT